MVILVNLNPCLAQIKVVKIGDKSHGQCSAFGQPDFGPKSAVFLDKSAHGLRILPDKDL